MSENTKGYQVLARKYRPETFVDLVGQDAMVRTLRNAFEADRIAQAFIMTGIRGTGKTLRLIHITHKDVPVFEREARVKYFVIIECGVGVPSDHLVV